VVEIDVSWFGKPSNRLPEASWISFEPILEDPDRWEIEKLGRWIWPLRVVSRGNRYKHGIGEGVWVRSRKTRLVIESQDAYLVSPGEPRMLRFDDSLPALGSGRHFCLHANLFGTNFSLWYDENGHFRFEPASEPESP